MIAVLVYSEKQMEILSRERRVPVCGPDPQPPPQGPFTMLKALSEPSAHDGVAGGKTWN